MLRHKVASVLLSLGSLVVLLIVVGIIGAAVGTGAGCSYHAAIISTYGSAH